jgi:hypothetical protein
VGLDTGPMAAELLCLISWWPLRFRIKSCCTAQATTKGLKWVMNPTFTYYSQHDHCATIETIPQANTTDQLWLPSYQFIKLLDACVVWHHYSLISWHLKWAKWTNLAAACILMPDYWYRNHAFITFVDAARYQRSQGCIACHAIAITILVCIVVHSTICNKYLLHKAHHLVNGTNRHEQRMAMPSITISCRMNRYAWAFRLTLAHP